MNNTLLDLILSDPDNTSKMLVRENNETFCQFDKIRVGRTDAETLNFEFYWKDQVVHTLLIECRLEPGGQQATCGGFTGRIPIDRTPSPPPIKWGYGWPVEVSGEE